MAFYYYQTEQFKKDIKAINIDDLKQVVRLRDALGKNGLFKRRQGNSRFVFFEYRINDEDTVWFFLRYFTNHQDYDYYIKRLENLNNIILKNDIDKWYEQQKNAVPNKKTLPDELKYWITALQIKTPEQEDIIYETTDWIEYIINNETQISLIYNNIFNNIDNITEITPLKNDKFVLRRFGTKYFLSTPNNNEDSEERLLRMSKRAYPKYLLADEDLWTQIEKEPQSNLAYSPEQIKLLNEIKFPLFINGPAGSGKSTMLFYLFADLIKQAKDRKQKGLYLTYSQKLLETAQDEVNRILKYGYNNIEGSDFINTDNYFFTFKDLIQSILKKQYPQDRYLSFEKFKIKYEDKKNRIKGISAELAWHIIRTYIRGYDLEYLTPTDYREIPRKSKTVTDNEFDQVYNKVWNKPWCQDLFESSWDEIKLIREIHKNKISIPKDNVFIFSDEAQDYTNLEIQFLLDLLPYDQYDYSKIQNVNIPVVFAGDPMQTLNPTGFRWERVKDIYNEIMKNIIERPVSLEIKNLYYNYRNAEEINGVANLIQYLRKEKLGIKEIEPSEAWFINSEKTVVALLDDFTRISVSNDFYNKFVFINENKNNLPKELENSKRVQNLFNIKGLEFDAIVLFNILSDFDDIKIELLEKLLQANDEKRKEILDNTNNRLFLEYLFNKLYVAITRAKNRLYIIEENNKRKKIWREAFYIEENELKEVWEKKIKKPNIIYTKDAIGTDPLKIAQNLDHEGRNQKNPDLLESAAAFYEKTDKEEKAKECLALSKKYKSWLVDNYGEKKRYCSEAGNLFEQIGLKEEAFDCFFIAADISKILKYSNFINNSVVRKIKFDIVNFIQNKQNINNLISNSSKIKEVIDLSLGIKNKLFNVLINNINKNNYKQHWHLLTNLREIYIVDTNKQSFRVLAEKIKPFKDWVIIRDILEKTKNTDINLYHEAIIQTEQDFFNRLPSLYKLKRYNDILNWWNGNTELGNNLTKEQLNIIAYTAFNSNNINVFIQLLALKNVDKRLLIENAIKKENKAKEILDWWQKNKNTNERNKLKKYQLEVIAEAALKENNLDVFIQVIELTNADKRSLIEKAIKKENKAKEILDWWQKNKNTNERNKLKKYQLEVIAEAALKENNLDVFIQVLDFENSDKKSLIEKAIKEKAKEFLYLYWLQKNKSSNEIEYFMLKAIFKYKITNIDKNILNKIDFFKEFDLNILKERDIEATKIVDKIREEVKDEIFEKYYLISVEEVCNKNIIDEVLYELDKVRYREQIFKNLTLTEEFNCFDKISVFLPNNLEKIDNEILKEDFKFLFNSELLAQTFVKYIEKLYKRYIDRLIILGLLIVQYPLIREFKKTWIEQKMAHINYKKSKGKNTEKDEEELEKKKKEWELETCEDIEKLKDYGFEITIVRELIIIGKISNAVIIYKNRIDNEEYLKEWGLKVDLQKKIIVYIDKNLKFCLEF